MNNSRLLLALFSVTGFLIGSVSAFAQVTIPAVAKTESSLTKVEVLQTELGTSKDNSSDKIDVPDAPSFAIERASSRDSSSGNVIAQRRGYGPMYRYPRRYPRGPSNYHYEPMPAFSPFGALIGFGLGATIGAASPDNATAGQRAALGLLVGGLGALMGGAIGGGVSHFNAMAHHNREKHHRPWSSETADENQEATLRMEPAR